MPIEKTVASVLNKHKKRDTWFLDDYSVNPYEGCSCNCLYCYVRGSKYGENMDDGLFIKTNAAAVLDKQLLSRAKKNQYGIIAVGSATDAYIHHEEKYETTKGILEIILKHKFPVFISTKTALIKRDIALLKEIDKAAILPADLQHLQHGVILSVSISTLDDKIASILEPAAIAPLQRLELVSYLKEQGFLVGVNAMPLLPYISDTNEKLEEIIAAAKNNGADYILPASLTLFGSDKADSKTLFYSFLERYDASLIEKYNALYGGNFYMPYWYQNDLKKRAEILCRKYNIRNSILAST